MDTQAIAARLTAAAQQLRQTADYWQDKVSLMPTLYAQQVALVSLLNEASAHVETLTQQVAELRTKASLDELARIGLQGHFEQAEQQRDAAHAALRELLEVAPYSRARLKAVAVLHAALAASAPQKGKVDGC